MKTKKYYWLKLKEDFFDDDTISWIEEQENGILYSNFYLKLCVKSIKTNGILIRNVGEVKIPYDIKKLAEITHVTEKTALNGMELLKKIGLVKILEDGEIYLTRMESMIGSETSKAAIMRKKRTARKFLLPGQGNIVTDMLPECYSDKEIDKEIDIEEDKEIKEDKEYDKDDMDDEKSGQENANLKDIAIDDNENYSIDDEENNKHLSSCKLWKYLSKCGFIITAKIKDFIRTDMNTFGYQWMREAADICVKNGRINYRYLTGILRNWKTEGRNIIADSSDATSLLSANMNSAYMPLKSIFA